MARKFTLYPGATVAMALALIILISLGNWQLQRRAWKLDLIDAVETRSTSKPVSIQDIISKLNEGQDVRYSAITVTGRYDHTSEAHVFGTLGPTPGYYIFTPITIDEPGFQYPIYVNRGFVPQANKEASTRLGGQISQTVTITGLFRYAENRSGIAKLVAPKNQPDANIWYNRDPIHFTQHFFDTKDQGNSWYIDSFGAENPARFPRGNTTRIDFNNRHLEYALTWFGLALTLLGVWFAYSWRRSEKTNT